MISVLIKPASGNCNMKCRYCFYYDVMDKREVRPTLAGLDFYKNLIVLQNKYNTKNIKIQNAIQTKPLSQTY